MPTVLRAMSGEGDGLDEAGLQGLGAGEAGFGGEGVGGEEGEGGEEFHAVAGVVVRVGPEVGDEDGDRAVGDGVDVEGKGEPEEEGGEGFAAVGEAEGFVAGEHEGFAGEAWPCGG